MTYDTSGIQLANIPHRHTNTHTQLLRRQPGTEREAEINKRLLCGVCVCMCVFVGQYSLSYLFGFYFQFYVFHESGAMVVCDSGYWLFILLCVFMLTLVLACLCFRCA